MEDDFVGAGVGMPVDFSTFNRFIITEDNIKNAKPFSTVQDNQEQPFEQQEQFQQEDEQESLSQNEFFAPPPNMDFVDQFSGRLSTSRRPTTGSVGDSSINNEIQQPSFIASNYSQSYTESNQTFNQTITSQSTQMTGGSQPFHTKTDNDAIWGNQSSASMHMTSDNRQDGSGLTKITINTGGGGPVVENNIENQQHQPDSNNQADGVTFESNYGNPEQNTSVTIKRIGGDEIKVNEQSTKSKRSNKIEVMPGLSLTESNVCLANVMKAGVGETKQSRVGMWLHAVHKMST